MIQVRNLVKQYGDHLAVDDLSFTIEKGLIYGFLGPNGAGKSTTMNIMTGYLSPTDGEVIVNGHNVLNEPEAAKRCIGYLPEIPPLYTEMTVKEYLLFAAELKSVPKEKRLEEVHRVVKLTHLESVYERLTGNLSKGYKQRVGVAQAIIGNPDIVILDEPTIGLDPKQIIEIRDVIRNLAKDHTVILSSHILSEVQEVCDHIIIINNGKLVANGSPAELEKQLGASTLELTVKSNNAMYVKSIISSIEGISGLECRNNAAENAIDVTVKLQRGADIREQVFYAYAKAQLPILMMKASEMSLENIFLQLTREKAPTMIRRRKKTTDSGKSAETEEAK